MISLAAFLYYVSEWVIRGVMLVVVVSRRRQPSSAMAWLLVIFSVPWLGVVLYLLVGENRLPRRRTEQHARILEELKAVSRRFENHPSVVRPKLRPESMATVTLAERLGYMPILGSNGVELMTQTDDVIDRLIADVDSAEHHVHLLFYIYADDETGRRVADALARAVERGVQCRVLVDSAGSAGMLKRLGPRMREQGVEVCEMLPVGIFRRRVARIDLRNHRKVAVIDGRIAYTGSQNIVNADYGHKDLAWHDMMAFLGTGNFDIRSFALNFEVNLLLYGAQVTERLRAEQRRYIAGSVRLTRAQWRKRPVVQKLLEKLAKLLSPLL